MANHEADLRMTVRMVLCALLSLVAFLSFLILAAYSDRLMAVLGVAASLVCPVVWLNMLLWNDGGAGGMLKWAKRRAALLRPALRRADARA